MVLRGNPERERVGGGAGIPQRAVYKKGSDASSLTQVSEGE
jgi:hypothetical protein